MKNLCLESLKFETKYKLASFNFRVVPGVHAQSKSVLNHDISILFSYTCHIMIMSLFTLRRQKIRQKICFYEYTLTSQKSRDYTGGRGGGGLHLFH